MFITKTGHLITPAEIEGWVAEAEAGYDLAGFTVPPGHIRAGHTADGPADCPRCQLLRDNAHWMDHMLVPHRHSHAGATGGRMAAEPHSHLHSHGGEHARARAHGNEGA